MALFLFNITFIAWIIKQKEEHVVPLPFYGIYMLKYRNDL